MNMHLSTLKDDLDRVLTQLAEHAFETRQLVFEAPAPAREVEHVERKLGFTLPTSFRDVVAKVSRRVDFSWYAPSKLEFPAPFAGNFSGQLDWDLKSIPQYEQHRAEWIKSAFPNPDDPYDAVWHNKLAITPIVNGDFLAIDMSPANFERVVYLSHDDGEGHGYVLADDFADYLRRCIPLACPGAEDWQWIPFTTARDSRIDPYCDNAVIWRRLLNVTF